MRAKSKYPLIDEMNSGSPIENWSKKSLISLIDEILEAHWETVDQVRQAYRTIAELARIPNPYNEPPRPPKSRHEMGG